MFKYYKKFPLEFQTKVHIALITVFVSLLVTVLVFMNSYNIFNRSYSNTIVSLDNSENSYLDEVLNYFSFQHHAIIHYSKLTNYQIRKFIELNLKYTDIIDDLPKPTFSSLHYLNFGEENEKLNKALDYASDFMKEIVEMKVSQDISVSLINGIVIGYGDSLYYYNTGQKNNETYGRDDFENEKKKYSTYSIQNYFNITKYESNDNKILSEIENNPFPYISQFDKDIILPFQIEETENDVSNIMNIISVKFDSSSIPDKVTNKTMVPLNNFIFFTVNPYFIVDFLPTFGYTGIVLTSSLPTGKLLFNLPCYYLMKRYYLENNDDSPFTEFPEVSNISECILHEDAKIQFNSFFSDSSPEPRKAKIKLLSSGTVLRTAVKIFGQKVVNLTWKIFSSMIPVQSDKFAFTSSFPINYQFKGYLFKDVTDSSNQRDDVYSKCFMHILLILSYILFLWLVISIIIFFVVSKTIKEIFSPIFELKQAVIKFNSSDNKQAIETLKSLRYNDDKDINDLFISCRKMLLGGFRDEESEEGIKHQKISEYEQNMSRVYNSISLIKSNNLIILNEEDFMKNLNNVFSYDVNDNIGVRNSRKGKKKISYKMSLVGTFEKNEEEKMLYDEENARIKEIKELCEKEENNYKKQIQKSKIEEIFDEVIGQDDL